jgi:hypothetical protein
MRHCQYGLDSKRKTRRHTSVLIGAAVAGRTGGRGRGGEAESLVVPTCPAVAGPALPLPPANGLLAAAGSRGGDELADDKLLGP